MASEAAAFADLGAHPQLTAALAAKGYEAPTPVQEAVLAEGAAGRDLLVSARTGSGKTVAFGLAISPQLLEGDTLPRPGKPLGLVVEPTRELAHQVARELQWLYGQAGARIATCVGGADMGQELRALKAGAHIVVGTPGRLCDHLERRSLALDGLRALVLDEADEMLDLGFRDELTRILRDAPAEKRTLLFSATIPEEIATLARKYQRNALRVAVNAQEKAHADIEIRAHLIAPREREHAVVNTLRFHDAPAAIVFCAKRESVNHLTQSLIERGFAAVPISGELSQAERSRALHALRDGRARVLVATDVAARGLDLPDVSLVIQADPPQNAEALQHRSGRTGRAGRKGVCVLLVPPGARRPVESMMKKAGVRAAFGPPPDADVIRVRDRDRLVREIDALAADPAEDDLALARQILRERDPEILTAALVKLRREASPAPEDLPFTAELLRKEKASAGLSRTVSTHPTRAGRGEELHDERPPKRTVYERVRERSAERGKPPARAEPGPAKAPASPWRGPKEGAPAGKRGRDDADSVWFRVNMGTTRNADPRWLLPILCRRGEVDRKQIGRIEVLANETRFTVSRAAAPAFRKAVAKPDKKDPNIRIMQIDA